ncbi:nuclear transport factor 2 family protein [Saccharopolyspora mangrovi]|uniref:Nuclear transport factor 2 family protein n=1 Tax=Saccharopolyspora mangrovi TaxID=3082379 RepID=A0ABU6AJI8_9PSEU|nr:nuclear transport factor 2 family protein [Saccharopolyspora sp. S2-29]MEB3371734.1 nuclear transport factor 2 family protein [Saccharopolyspora sp. S2-29]
MRRSRWARRFQDVPADLPGQSQYCFYVDTKEWDRLRMLFSEEATFAGFSYTTDDPYDFVRGVSSFLESVRSVHHAMMPELRAIDERRVRGRWSMHDMLTWEPDSFVYKGIEIPGMHGINGYGYYDEEYTRVGGKWYISHMQLTRLRIDPLFGGLVEPPRYDVPPPDTEWFVPDR